MFVKGLLLLVSSGICTLCLPDAAQAKPKNDKQTLQRLAPTLKARVLQRALRAYRCAQKKGIARRSLLAIVDYTLPSSQKRLWVFDMRRKKRLYHEWVAHGKGSGNLFARQFSNRPNSLQSSLGLYVTQELYHGKHGLSLRLRGLEKGFNDKARQRAIVMHGAWYVSRAFLKQHKRLGRSWGCPAVRKKITRPLLQKIQKGAVLYIYGPDPRWLRRPPRCP